MTIRDLPHYAREALSMLLEFAAIALFALFLIGLAGYLEGVIQ